MSDAATDRRVVVLVVPATGTWAPPGRSAEAWRLALAEDTYEVLASLDRVDVAGAVVGGDDASIAEISALTWPDTPVYSVAPSHPVLDAVRAVGPAAAVVAVSHDVPDLPGLLIGKLFRALGSADLAVCPAEDGTQAAIGVNLPPASWLPPTLDFDISIAELDAAKPRRLAVAIGPGWHRLRSNADLARLDPGLEGWDATRSILRGA
jgi:CHASE2 domain-containing sensor protein